MAQRTDNWRATGAPGAPSMPLAIPERRVAALLQRSQWLRVTLFLLSARLLLNIPAWLGAHRVGLGEGIAPGFGAGPLTLPGIWSRWDAGYYLHIARYGYSLHGVEVSFLPGYPLLLRAFALGLPSLMPWSAVFVSNVAFVLAGLLLWDQVRKEHNERDAWGAIVTLSLFPTSFFFSAIYAESLFLLLSVLVYWLSARKRYLLAGCCISLASVTRITGIFLVIIPLIELLRDTRQPRRYRTIVLTGCSAAIGLGIYGWYSLQTQGSPTAYLATEKGTSFQRAITWPWRTLSDSFLVLVSGRGGFQDNWFMRAVSMQDLLAAALFACCAVAAFFTIRRSLALYGSVVLFFLLCSHGPATLGLYSLSRYVLALFPFFIVLGIVLARTRHAKWIVWGVSAFLLCLTTAWFASGRWVA